jgi:hypothetical protein
MATLIDRLIPRTFAERLIAVLVALLLAGLISNAFRVTYFWGDDAHRVCLRGSFVGSYPAVDPSFCRAADADDDARLIRRAHEQELRRLEHPPR